MLNQFSGYDFQMKFTKFLDVKNPISGTNKSIGYDLHLPKMSKEFLDAIQKLNDCTITTIFDDNGTIIKAEGIKKPIPCIGDVVNKLVFIDDDYLEPYVLFIYDTKVAEFPVFVVLNNMTIPTGIGFDLPENVFADIRPRSSNLKNNFTCILGTVDEDYTYGCGAQVMLANSVPVVFIENERMCQVVFQHGKKWELVEEPIHLFESTQSIIDKRESRSGGFGHTGKN